MAADVRFTGTGVGSGCEKTKNERLFLSRRQKIYAFSYVAFILYPDRLGGCDVQGAEMSLKFGFRYRDNSYI
jgi:hypothetical protein